MIQELLGGAGLLGVGEKKFSFNGVFEGLTPSPSLSPTTSSCANTNTNATTTTTNNNTHDQQNLRCPRCDSSNTKFCYYNNYNLTQPRHFCKTCRRYWTKGGALRNVPIGGGCRKNKTITISMNTGKSSNGSKVKSTTSSTENVKSNLGGNNGLFDQEHTSATNPISWASPHSSQLLALLRASTTTQNPNPNMMKDIDRVMIGSHMGSDHQSSALNGRTTTPTPTPPPTTTTTTATTLNIDPLGLCSNSSASFWRNNQHHHQLSHQSQQQQQHQQPQPQPQPQPQQQHGFLMGEVQNTGIQELYQKLRSTSAANNNYYNSTSTTTSTDHHHHAPVVLSSNVGSSSSSMSILESAPVVGGGGGGGGEMGYWNHPQFSWTDLHTTNGAFP